METVAQNLPLITEDTVVFGILMAILALVFYTSSLDNRFAKKFYAVIPPLLLCYFLPGLLNSFGIISGEHSNIYFIASNYLLPACLVLFTLSLNLGELWKMRKNAGIMFLAGMVGVVLGGPIAVWIMAQFAPHVVSGETWKALSTLAGSWIGGGANQAALYTIFEPVPEDFSATIAVDVFVAYTWMALLIYGASKAERINKYFKADNSSVDELTKRMAHIAQTEARNPMPKDYFIMIGLAFGAVAVGHVVAGFLAESIQEHAPELSKFSLTSKFFWLIVVTTFLGISLSFTRARNYEGAGASKLATVFLYVLIASIGMQMNIFAILQNPGLFVVGLIWITFHALVLFLVAKLIRAPFFFFAMGSMGNIGGVASASVTAAAFHPSLISVSVIISVFSYAVGTYAGYLCGILMQMVAPY
ncbi:MAG TPA: DUF819 family protein [Sphingobacteriaceae bacterium]|nr:DUF819 family protein [Sphingobacteriaceae bacterium]